VTSLNNQLFVVRFSGQQQIEVYDSTTLIFQRTIHVPGLNHTYGLASCAVNNCLYVTECESNLVYRVELLSSSNTVMRCRVLRSKWSVGRRPWGISTNSENNVLVTCCNDHNIQEYTTHGSLIRDISLSSVGITFPACSIQLPNGHIAVSYDHGVCVVDINGVLIRNHNNTTGASVQFNSPREFSLVQSGCTLLACGKNQLVLFNPSFTSSRVLSLPNDSPLHCPRSLFLDESRGRLYIGEWSRHRVFVFDNVFNVGTDFQ